MSEQLQPLATTDTIAEENASIVTRSFASADRAMALAKGAAYVFEDAHIAHLEPTSKQVFRESYDASLPTIGFDSYAIGVEGEALLARAAMEGQKVANIVHVNSGSRFGEYAIDAQGRSQLIVSGSGVITTPRGAFMPIRFPHEIPVDMLVTSETDVRMQARNFGLPQPFVEEGKLDLEKQKELFPQRYTEADLINGLRQQIVIKPSNRFGGMGIGMFDTRHTKRALEYYDFLQQHGYKPVIEERLQGPFLTDPRTGRKKSWNVRAIINQGEVIGGYIRAAGRDGAVNKAQGATMIPMHELEKFVGGRNPKRRAQKFREIIWDTSARLAEAYPEGYLGPDIFIDNAHNGRVFEVNTLSVGGLDSIAHLARTKEEKIAPARQVIEAWAGRAALRRMLSAPEPCTKEQSNIGVVAGIQLLATHGNSKALRQFSIDDFNLTGPDGVTIARQLSYYKRELARKEGDEKAVIAIDREHRECFPLDMHNMLPRLIETSPDPREYTSHVARLSYFLPHDQLLKSAFTALTARMLEGTFL